MHTNKHDDIDENVPSRDEEIKRIISNPGMFRMRGEMDPRILMEAIFSDRVHPERVLFELLNELMHKAMNKEIPYNMGSAHYTYDILNDIPIAETEKLYKLTERFESPAYAFTKMLSQKKTNNIEEIVLDMHSRETTLKFNPKQLIVNGKSTRYAMRDVIKITTMDKNKHVALPLPNWHFWELFDGENEEKKFAFFEASSPEQLLDGFRKVAKRGNIGSLVLVNPSNPLGYKIDQKLAEEIDVIAQKYGIDIIVDDVLRGVQPIGDRESIGIYFSRPYIVEGFSKRFGDEPIGEVSAYTILPKDVSGKKFRSEANIAKKTVVAELMRMAFAYSEKPAIEELTARNRIFSDRLLSHDGDIKVYRPSESHLLTVLELPNTYWSKSTDLDDQLMEKGVVISPIEMYKPDDFQLSENYKNKFRITVGRISSCNIAEAADLIGETIRTMKNE